MVRAFQEDFNFSEISDGRYVQPVVWRELPRLALRSGQTLRFDYLPYVSNADRFFADSVPFEGEFVYNAPAFTDGETQIRLTGLNSRTGQFADATLVIAAAPLYPFILFGGKRLRIEGNHLVGPTRIS